MTLEVDDSARNLGDSKFRGGKPNDNNKGWLKSYVS